jgi:hypothetical protein
MFTAYLLVLDALRSGVEVVACVDSSPARIGACVFGVPVLPHAQLGALEESIDAIILSSERDHEDGIKKMISLRLDSTAMPMISWKELADLDESSDMFVEDCQPGSTVTESNDTCAMH